MKLLYGAYTMVTSGLFLSGLPSFWLYTLIRGRYRGTLKERVGCISQDLTRALTGSPRIWMHAASLGEVRVAESIINAMRSVMPDCSIVLSTITEPGRDLAIEIFGDQLPVIYAPIDFIGSVRKALYSIRPDVLVFTETEIWPAWITEAHRMGIKIALVNGRISMKSFKSYIKFRPFFSGVLSNVDRFSMIMEKDRSRIRAIGADPEKIVVNGNAKYDLLADLADPSVEEDMRNILDIEPSCPVFIAGSTRNGEEPHIIDAYKKILKEFPDTILLIAPRHIERTGQIAALLEGHNLRYQLRSKIAHNNVKRTEKIVIINSFGELSKLYSVGTIVFCGGSLVPLGGQNPLEAAVWGKAIFYGPHMDAFLDAKGILEANDAGIQISSSEMLAEKAIGLLKDPGRLGEQGTRAREAVLKNRNAGESHARVISDLIYQ